MNRNFAIGMLAVSLAALWSGCSRSPRVTYYTLEPVARLGSVTPAMGIAAAPAAALTTPMASDAAGRRAAASNSAANPGGAATPAATSAATGTPVTVASPAAAPAPAAANSAISLAAASIAVGPVTLPELVDRPQLVVRVAPNRVSILESERWAEPLRSEIPRVIAQDLGRLLGSGQVTSYLQRAGTAAELRVLIDIERFEASPGEAVSVEAVWSLHRAAGGIAQTGRSRVREAVAGEGYDPLVAAYGRALLAVSADLARVIRAEGAAGR
jgi:uncharacterized protein